MAVVRQVISTLTDDGDYLGLDSLAWRWPSTSILDGSLLTVEPNQFAIVKTRGVVMDVFSTGQHTIKSGDKVILGSLVQGFFGGNSPWQFEVIYIQRSKILIHNEGIATTREMAEVSYVADYYVHVDTKQGALDLLTHMPISGNRIPAGEIASYAGPAIEQAINQKIQRLSLEQVNLNGPDILEACKTELETFLRVYGISLNELKVVFTPRDKRVREIVAFRALGLSDKEAIRAYLAAIMAERGAVSAPNMMVGESFNIGSYSAGIVPVSGAALSLNVDGKNTDNG